MMQPKELKLATRWDKTFPKSAAVKHSMVTAAMTMYDMTRVNAF